jgi:hypothetical protein
MISGYILLSLFVYLSWKIWIIADRYQRIDKRFNFILTLETFYTFAMFYLLSISSLVFFVVALITAFTHTLFGVYVEIFKPEIRLMSTSTASKNILSDYWSFLVIDTSITFLSYFLVIGGQ